MRPQGAAAAPHSRCTLNGSEWRGRGQGTHPTPRSKDCVEKGLQLRDTWERGGLLRAGPPMLLGPHAGLKKGRNRENSRPPFPLYSPQSASLLHARHLCGQPGHATHSMASPRKEERPSLGSCGHVCLKLKDTALHTLPFILPTPNTNTANHVSSI